MGLGVLILGKSGTGKSCSLRNFNSDEVSIINVNGKPFPFKNKFEKVFVNDDKRTIQAALKAATSKTIIIDDSQYIMANEYMRRCGEKNTFAKFEEIGRGFWDLVMSIKELPEDTIVYFLHHEETNEYGEVSAKTQGKMIDNHICLEGMYSMVIRSRVQDGKYLFQTHNGGNDTVKTPMGMFEEDYIENDLKIVDQKIREYYGFDKKETK